MKTPMNQFVVCFSACILLAACGGSAKKDVWKNVPMSHPAARDNDNYYSQPSTYGGCATITDAPSCAGGG